MVNPEEIAKKIEDKTFTPSDLPDFFQIACDVLNSSKVGKDSIKGWNCKIQYDLGGENDVWFKSEDDKASSGTGSIEGGADMTMILSPENAVKMFTGELDGMAAYMGGQLKIEGNMMESQKFGSVMQVLQQEIEKMGN
ncbi:MAG: SCP2 sterol-binding domain-containing protein [Promethearchaeota archaeon]